MGPADSEATGDLSWLSPVRTPELLSCRTDARWAPFLGPYINSCGGPFMAESGEDAGDWAASMCMCHWPAGNAESVAP